MRADPNVKNKAGQSPKDLAREKAAILSALTKDENDEKERMQRVRGLTNQASQAEEQRIYFARENSTLQQVIRTGCYIFAGIGGLITVDGAVSYMSKKSQESQKTLQLPPQ